MTGRAGCRGFAGHNCKGREKVRRLRQYIAQYMPESDCELSGYGNLPDDIPLLEAAVYR